jgi:hypothetical protein
VERAYGGDVVQGRYVSPEAYAAFLRGAMAEASGRSEDAVAAYADAARRDPSSPEPWTRIAQVLCAPRAGAPLEAPSVSRGVAAAEHATSLDPGYARAWVARAQCAGARGDEASQRAAAARAVQLGDTASALRVRVSAGASGERDRNEVVALTLAARDPVSAWDALAAWSQAHGDVALWTRALVELVRLAPERRGDLAAAAEELAGIGATGEARTVAGAVVDAGAGPLPPARVLAPRLAVDDAIARGDAAVLRRRAARGRLSLEEAAGRALLAGQVSLARDLAAEVAGADPHASGARLVLAVADRAALAPFAASRSGDAPVSAATFVAFAGALHRTGAADAATLLAGIAHASILPGDDLVLRPAVELAAGGLVPAEILPPDGIVELAVVTRAAPAVPPRGAADPRHRYLALAATQPTSPETRALAERLHGVAATDLVVAAADALVQLAAGSTVDPAAPRALLARDPADPLLAAVALRLAEKCGDTDVARRARESLTALRGSPRSLE